MLVEVKKKCDGRVSSIHEIPSARPFVSSLLCLLLSSCLVSVRYKQSRKTIHIQESIYNCSSSFNQLGHVAVSVEECLVRFFICIMITCVFLLVFHDHLMICHFCSCFVCSYYTTLKTKRQCCVIPSLGITNPLCFLNLIVP